MTIESAIVDIILADGTITALVDDRVYAKEDLGPDGLTGQERPDIYNSDIELQTCIMVKERDVIADGQVIDFEDKEMSALQIVEIYIYQERGYGDIDAIRSRLRKILMGEYLDNTFELEWVLDIPRLQDEAALAGASLGRQDWSFNIIL